MKKLDYASAVEYFTNNFILKRSTDENIEIIDIGIILFYNQEFYDKETGRVIIPDIKDIDQNKLFKEFINTEREV